MSFTPVVKKSELDTKFPEVLARVEKGESFNVVDEDGKVLAVIRPKRDDDDDEPPVPQVVKGPSRVESFI